MASLLDPNAVPRPQVGADPGVQASTPGFNDAIGSAISGFGQQISNYAKIHQALQNKRQGAEDQSFLDAYQLEFTKRATQAQDDALNSPAISDPNFVTNLDKTIADKGKEARDAVIQSGGYSPTPDALARADHITMAHRADVAGNAVTQANNQRVSLLVDNADKNAQTLAQVAANTGDLDGALTRIDGYAQSLNGVLAPDKVRSWAEARKSEVVQQVVHGYINRGQIDEAQKVVDRYTGYASGQASFNGQTVIGAAKKQGVDPATGLALDFIEGGSVPGGKQPPVTDRFLATPAAPPGMVTKGTIDLTTRPIVKNADGTVSTVRSISIEEDGKEILIPTVADDGHVMSDKEATAAYDASVKAGSPRHLGVFNDAKSADTYAEQLHNQQAAMVAKPQTAGVRTYGMSTTVLSSIDRAGVEEGISPSLLRMTAAIESGGDPSMPENAGHNAGLMQLSPDIVQQFGGGDRMNAYDASKITAREYASFQKQFTAQFGRPATDAELYLMHQQGAGGLPALVKNPSAVAWQVLLPFYQKYKDPAAMAKSAVWDNMMPEMRAKFPGGVNTVTSADFVTQWNGKVAEFGGSGGVYTVDDPAITARMTKIASDTKFLTTALGTPPTPAELYLSSLMGPQATVTFMQANADMPVVSFLPPDVLKEHPEFKDMDVQTLHKFAADKMQVAMQATQGELAGKPIYADSSVIPLSAANTLNNEVNSARNQQKGDYTNLIKDDVASIRATGVPLNVDADKAKTLLSPAQWTSWQDQRHDAQTFYSATNDMATLSNADLQARTEALRPQAGQLGYDRADQVYKDVGAEAKRLTNLRASDPAEAVTGVPAVAEAMKSFDSKDPVASWGRVFDARIAAQHAIGIDPALIQPLTASETKQITAGIKAAASSAAGSLGDNAFMNTFQRAANDAELLYGPYSDEVMKQVLGEITGLNTVRADSANVIIGNILNHQKIAASDLWAVTVHKEADKQASAFDPLGMIAGAVGAVANAQIGTEQTDEQKKNPNYIANQGSPDYGIGATDPDAALKGALLDAQKDPAFQAWQEQFFKDPAHTVPGLAGPGSNVGTIFRDLKPAPQDIEKLRNNPNLLPAFIELYGKDKVPPELLPKGGAIPPQSAPTNVFGGVVPHKTSKTARKTFQDLVDEVNVKAKGATTSEVAKPASNGAADFLTGPALGKFLDGVISGTFNAANLAAGPPPTAEQMKDVYQQAKASKYIDDPAFRDRFKEAFGPKATIEGLSEADLQRAYTNKQNGAAIQDTITFFRVLMAIFGSRSAPDSDVQSTKGYAPTKGSGISPILGVRG